MPNVKRIVQLTLAMIVAGPLPRVNPIPSW